MITLSFHFPAGQYHATPWGQHVNEGSCEWPPSPWRIARALVATGYSKLGWCDPVPATAQSLIEQLGGAVPRYLLPKSSTAHTRHYMPTREGTSEKNKLIFDTFHKILPEDPLLVQYDIDLDSEQRQLLKLILNAMSYLGRAESWVDGDLLEVSPESDHHWCQVGSDPPPGGDQLSLLAPMAAQAYNEWRDKSFFLTLEQEQEKKPGKKITAKQLKNVEAVYPSGLYQALCSDNGLLQKQGWSQPPGSRRLLYARPAHLIDRQPIVRLSSRSPRTLPTAALLSLSGGNVSQSLRPLVIRCLPQSEFLHRGLLSKLGDAFSPALRGRDAMTGEPLQGHQHLHHFPLDLDQDGCIDHYLLYAPMGLDGEAQRSIANLRVTYAKKRPDIVVRLCGYGDIHDFSSSIRLKTGQPIPMLQTAQVWESLTPFVAPLHLGKKTLLKDLNKMIKDSCRNSMLPEPSLVEILDTAPASFRRFVVERSGSKKPPHRYPWALRISFDEPITGPLALGYASHFGLGIFVPAAAVKA